MTLQELIDALEALRPTSARTAAVLVDGIDDVLDVKYVDGEVIVNTTRTPE